MTAPQWHFEDFRLDLVNACLWHGAEALALPPKAFNVLHYLVTHPGRLVTKDELWTASGPIPWSRTQWCAWPLARCAKR
jgi:DNA-binding response OmpR family regulator